MKRSHRDFIKISGGALGALAVPSEAVKASAQEAVAIVETDASGGSVTFGPVEGVGGEHGTWTVTHRVGPKGIKQRAGVRVQLPGSWHAGRIIRYRAQPILLAVDTGGGRRGGTEIGCG
jgi:hypothetical protein